MFGTHKDWGPGQRVEVPVAGSLLEGDLWLPHDAPAIVVFPHGRGTSRSAAVALAQRWHLEEVWLSRTQV